MRKSKRHVRDAYRFPGFVPKAEVYGLFGEPMLRVVPLRRRRKKPCVVSVAVCAAVSTIDDRGWRAICRAARCKSTWSWKYAEWPAQSAEK